MGEMEARLVMAGAVALLALGVGRLWGRGEAWIRHRIQAPDLAAGLYLFTGAGCGSCSRARTALTEAGAAFDEVAHEEDPALFVALRIDRVPATVSVGDDHAWIAYGVPSGARLRRWLSLGP